MDPHFRAFSFVDRIVSLQPGKRVAGNYRIPAALAEFPLSLVVEAVGQLAAWGAMAAVEFTHRPVAGLAGRVELLSPVQPGQTLELAAEIESVDAEAVAYDGTASVEGRPVARLQHCVGPMLPLNEFDDPEIVRQRLTLLIDTGAAPGAFAGVPDLGLEDETMTSADTVQATLRVPRQAAFFGDHFPRRPVFPGTLLTLLHLKLAVGLMQRLESSPTQWRPRVISDVKLRSFTAPGDVLELEARKTSGAGDTATMALQVRASGKRVGGCRVEMAREEAQ